MELHSLPHAVVVTYQPNDVNALLRELARQCQEVTVVDNGSRPELLAPLRACCERLGAQLVELGANRGIAAAQNIGISVALEQGAQHVLLSDQDSRPAPDMVKLLLEAMQEDARVAAVGPLPAEEGPDGDELVYVDRGWGPKRATKADLRQSRLEAAFLIASGCLVRREALEDVGPMREDLFIDHVDLEWGVRARNRGWRLLAVPEAGLTHSLGDKAVRIPGRAQPVHLHSPLRNYYMVRNTITLIRWSGLPARWRAGYCFWGAKYAAFNALAAGQGRQRRRMLAQGLRDGIRGRLGPYPYH